MNEESEARETPQAGESEAAKPESEKAAAPAAEPSASGDSSDDSPGRLSRRGFVLGAMTVIGGIAAAIIAIPTAAFMSAPGWLSQIPKRLLSETVSPALRSDEWSSAGPLDDLRLGEPKYMLIKRAVVDGFVEREAEVGVWVVRSGEAEANVFDPHCTHLGCPVSWASGSASFLSPCHGGVFDVEGFPTSGPPPRRLDIYETRIEDGEIMVGKMLDSV